MREAINRQRKHGTIVSMPKNGIERIEAIRNMLKQKQYSKIDNCMIDTFSASAIITVYDALNPTNQAKFSNMPAPKMAILAFKLIK